MPGARPGARSRMPTPHFARIKPRPAPSSSIPGSALGTGTPDESASPSPRGAASPMARAETGASDAQSLGRVDTGGGVSNVSRSSTRNSEGVASLLSSQRTGGGDAITAALSGRVSGGADLPVALQMGRAVPASAGRSWVQLSSGTGASELPSLPAEWTRSVSALSRAQSETGAAASDAAPSGDTTTSLREPPRPSSATGAAFPARRASTAVSQIGASPLRAVSGAGGVIGAADAAAASRASDETPRTPPPPPVSTAAVAGDETQEEEGGDDTPDLRNFVLSGPASRDSIATTPLPSAQPSAQSISLRLQPHGSSAGPTRASSSQASRLVPPLLPPLAAAGMPTSAFDLPPLAPAQPASQQTSMSREPSDPFLDDAGTDGDTAASSTENAHGPLASSPPTPAGAIGGNASWSVTDAALAGLGGVSRELGVAGASDAMAPRHVTRAQDASPAQDASTPRSHSSDDPFLDG